MSVSENTENKQADAAPPDVPPHEPALVEIGLLVAGRLDEADWRAVQQAREAIAERLESLLPQFRWRLPIVRRDELTQTLREEPAVLLDYAVTERNLRHWDFSVIITGADLVSHYRPDAISVVSRSLEAIVISTSRLDPQARNADCGEKERVAAMAHRLKRLVIHGIGHLNNLVHSDDHDNYMFDLESVEDVDRTERFSEDQIERLSQELEKVADRRLEESASYRRSRPGSFYLASSWINRREIFAALREARPWQFPFRLARLTTAAVSALLILVVTAEVWELALAQSYSSVAVFSVFAIAATTFYVFARQRLYVHGQRGRLTEQTVTTNVSAMAIVLLGMITTYFSLFALAFLVGAFFFTPAIVQSWAGSYPQGSMLFATLTLAGFTASLGLFIGALGASFESNHYFRHITFVDEEI